MVEADDGFVAALGAELGRVQRVARLLVADADVAEELVAEAVARSLPHWRSGGLEDAGAYLRRVVVNLAARRRYRLGLARRRDSRSREWWAQPPDLESIVAERDRTLRALMRLPPGRRAVLVLRFYDDQTEAAIAELLGIAVGTVKSQLSRGLAQLRADLEAQT